jgi:hypothetical protein
MLTQAIYSGRRLRREDDDINTQRVYDALREICRGTSDIVYHGKMRKEDVDALEHLRATDAHLLGAVEAIEL